MTVPKPAKLPAHVNGGNCWHRKTLDVCKKHDEPRGECGRCPRCPVCEAPLAHRINLNDDGSFDELVVSAPKGDALIHAEMMDRRSIFVSIGPIRLWAYVNADGVAEITHTETDEQPPTPPADKTA